MIRPAPLRTDGSNAFARYSMQVRVPRILRDVLEANPDFSPAVRADVAQLATTIEADERLPHPRSPAPDLEAWSTAHAEHEGETWLGGPWFHAELAVYRELVTRVRFWETDRDPFMTAKEAELASPQLWSHLHSGLAFTGPRELRLGALLDGSLWGNRVDLSYAVAAGRARRDEDLVVDDRRLAVRRLASARRVDLIADNTGTELALDLALVDALLERPGTEAHVHVKAQPVFVSDAMPRDVWRLLAAMERRDAPAKALSERLRDAFDHGRLRLVPDLFWSGPRFLWDAPSHLASALATSDVVLFKGDANYRRLVGDAVWNDTATFAEVASYVGAHVVCARTLKSDALVGVPADLARNLDESDPRWRIDGSRGVVQAAEVKGKESVPTT